MNATKFFGAIVGAWATACAVFVVMCAAMYVWEFWIPKLSTGETMLAFVIAVAAFVLTLFVKWND